MSHNHDHEPHNYNRAFAIGVALNLGYVIVEGAFGWLSGSLALLADAGHNLSDVLGLLLAWAAHRLGSFKPSGRRTYGWRSTSIFAALLNAVLLLVAVGGIAWEAVHRFKHPAVPPGLTVVAVAGVGMIVNLLTALMFASGRRGDLNIKGAYLHMAADAGVSLGVVVAGIAMYLTGKAWIDPAASLLVAFVILVSTWGLFRDSVYLALHFTPPGVDLDGVRLYLQKLPGVDAVHDLHVWAMSTTETALTVHLVKPHIENEDALLESVAKNLHDQFGIEHVTIQIERCTQGDWCKQAPEDLL